MHIYSLLRECVKSYKFTSKNIKLMNTEKFNICLYKTLTLIFLMINITNAKMPFLNLKQRTNLTEQLQLNELYKQSFLMLKLPTYLTDQDFINAKYVDISKPLKSIINDQHFSISRQLKRFRRGSVVTQESDKWPEGRIPYVLSSTYTTNQRAILARAIASYNVKTCIRFVPKIRSDKDYIVISKLDGCYADFARVGGRQQVSLSDECIEYATIIHEFMHVIGFIHEHQREDRDSFVTILFNNVIKGANTDFDKLSAVGLSNYGETYDYFSIMHYESTEGSRNGKNTIEAKEIKYTPLMGKSTDFTSGDLNRINRAYACRGYLR